MINETTNEKIRLVNATLPSSSIEYTENNKIKGKVYFIDVGNILPNKVDDYMEEMICYYNNLPYVKKQNKIKKWIYNLFDTLGIAGSLGGF